MEKEFLRKDCTQPTITPSNWAYNCNHNSFLD